MIVGAVRGVKVAGLQAKHAVRYHTVNTKLASRKPESGSGWLSPPIHSVSTPFTVFIGKQKQRHALAPPGHTGVARFAFMKSCLPLQLLQHHSACVSRGIQPSVSSVCIGSIASAFFWAQSCLAFISDLFFSVLMD